MSDSTKEQLGGNYGVKGWLFVLCFALIIGGPLASLFNVIMSFQANFHYFDQFPGLKFMTYINGILLVTLMVLSINSGIILWRIKPGAVRIAQNYFIISLLLLMVSAFLPLLSGLPNEAKNEVFLESVKNSLRPIFIIGIWYRYLSVSKRVKATYLYYPTDEASEKYSN